MIQGAIDSHLALCTLPAEQRRALEPRYFADLELSEIALVTVVPLGMVKWRIHRALQSLRASLQVKKERLML